MKLSGVLSFSLLLLPQLACEKSSFSGGGKQSKGAEKSAEQAPADEKLGEDPASDSDPVANGPDAGGGADESLDPNALFFECGNDARLRFVADLYQLPEDTEELPNFSELKSVKQICLQQIDIAPRDFEEGFPGVADLFEWFALNISFKVQIPVDGEYEFRLNSDDGSKLFIDDKQIIDNDGQHKPTSKKGKTQLKAGEHRFNVQYFQGPRFNIALELFMKAPNAAETYIPVDLVSRP